MLEIAKKAISTMNYMFLKEVFEQRMSKQVDMNDWQELEEKWIYVCMVEEISLYLDQIVTNMPGEVKAILKTELDEGDYLENLTQEQIKPLFEKATEFFTGVVYEEVVNVYMSYVHEILEDRETSENA